jgi:hypothetical protein
MKKLTALLAAGLVLGASGMAMAAGAGDTATTSATATATVYTPIEIDNTEGLAFGNIVAAAGGGTVTVPAIGGTPERTGNAGLMPANLGTVTAAEFTATGQSGAAYSVTVPASGEVANTTGTGAETMVLSDFTSKLANGTTDPGNLTDGSEVFYVGATLAVGATQVAGAYTGTFNVSVNYN